MRNGPRNGRPGVTSTRLAKSDPIREHFGLGHQIRQRDAGEGVATFPESNRRRSKTPPSGHPLIADPAVLDLDPCMDLVGKADGVRVQKRVDVWGKVRWWLVVVGDPSPEGKLENTLQRGGRYPRQTRCFGGQAHLATTHPRGRLHVTVIDQRLKSGLNTSLPLTTVR